MGVGQDILDLDGWRQAERPCYGYRLCVGLSTYLNRIIPSACKERSNFAIPAKMSPVCTNMSVEARHVCSKTGFRASLEVRAGRVGRAMAPGGAATDHKGQCSLWGTGCQMSRKGGMGGTTKLGVSLGRGGMGENVGGSRLRMSVTVRQTNRPRGHTPYQTLRDYDLRVVSGTM